MINGFFIEINNLTSKELSVPLFAEFICPSGFSVHAKDSIYDYQALLLIAKTKGFIGQGIVSTFSTRVWMNNGQEAYTLEPGVPLTELTIRIDGSSAFINLIVPPIEKGIFQLIQQY